VLPLQVPDGVLHAVLQLVLRNEKEESIHYDTAVRSQAPLTGNTPGDSVGMSHNYLEVGTITIVLPSPQSQPNNYFKPLTIIPLLKILTSPLQF
jgi:hypothetical protein